MAALYLKYRPKNIDELDLKVAREALSEIVKSGNIPHAFLFSGPKGTGKTSAARILSKIVNCENRKKGAINPCNKCESCKSIDKGASLDIIELDAASHRGIDDIRALKEAIKLSPSSSEKKIYIIDEAHMLTTEASNALLKTLEEPPSHALFVLATTNPEKLIPTIRSRVTSVLFKKAGKEEVVRSLERVAKGEKVKYEKDALETIAEASDGSFRDAVKIFEQILSQGGKINQKEVKEFVYGGAFTGTLRLFELLKERKVKEALEEVSSVIGGGLSARLYMENLLVTARQALLAKSGIGEDELSNFSKDELLELTKLLLAASRDIQGALVEELPLELAVIEWCGENESEDAIDEEDEEEEEEETSGPEAQQSGGKKAPKPAKSKKAKNFTNGVGKTHVKVDGKPLDETIWRKILELVRPRNTSTEALLRAAKPLQFDGKNLTLGVFYSFHKEHLEGNFHRSVLEEVVESVLGEKIRVSCLLTDPPPRKVVEKAKEEPVLTEERDEDIVKVAEEIFGN